jgi:2-polyprenyl-6-methoxyphenol hydroxylase-like FAD-dependent oxidoreductase
VRIIVIGGGIGGLTAAIALVRVGIDAQIYEHAPALTEVGAGIALGPNATHALDAIALGDRVRSQSLVGLQGGLRKPNGGMLAQLSSGEFADKIGTVAVMHRAELLDLLLREIDPARLHLGRACAEVEQDRGEVTVRFHDGETARADALLGADGLRSTIRAQAFGNPPIRYAGYTAWRAVVDFDGIRNPMVQETWGRGCRFGIVPMSRGRVYWFATKNAPGGQRDPEGGAKDTLSEAFRGWHEPIQALISAAKEHSILRNDIYDLDPLPNFVRGRIGLLGDAAHAMTPNMGQGACQAIEDAVVLAACLRKNGSVESGLLEYERRRRPRTKRFVLQSRRLGAFAQKENPILCLARDALIRMTPRRITAGQMNSLLSFEILAPSERRLFN